MLRSPELHPNPENATLEELRVAMDAAPNLRSYIRLNVIRSLLLKIPRATVCAEWHVVKPTLYWDIFHGGDTHEIDVEAL